MRRDDYPLLIAWMAFGLAVTAAIVFFFGLLFPRSHAAEKGPLRLGANALILHLYKEQAHVLEIDYDAGFEMGSKVGWKEAYGEGLRDGLNACMRRQERAEKKVSNGP